MSPRASDFRASEPQRPLRHRSRQRESILAWLRHKKTHPTAAKIHAGLRRELPNLSLGTVYRNLELLCEEGEARAVRSSRGGTRYDGNLSPHHHFHCDGCGAISDVEISAPRNLATRLQRDHGLVAERVSIYFHGFCESCQCADERSHP